MRGQGDRAGCIRSHLEPATQCEAWLCCPRRGPAVPPGVTVLALSQSKAVASGESPSFPAPRQSDEKQRGEAQLGQSSACQPLSPERCLALSFPGLPGSWSSVRSPVYPQVSGQVQGAPCWTGAPSCHGGQCISLLPASMHLLVGGGDHSILLTWMGMSWPSVHTGTGREGSLVAVVTLQVPVGLPGWLSLEPECCWGGQRQWVLQHPPSTRAASGRAECGCRLSFSWKARKRPVSPAKRRVRERRPCGWSMSHAESGQGREGGQGRLAGLARPAVGAAGAGLP